MRAVALGFVETRERRTAIFGPAGYHHRAGVQHRSGVQLQAISLWLAAIEPLHRPRDHRVGPELLRLVEGAAGQGLA